MCFLEYRLSATSVLPEGAVIHHLFLVNCISFAFLWTTGKLHSLRNLDNINEKHGLGTSLLLLSKKETERF